MSAANQKRGAKTAICSTLTAPSTNNGLDEESVKGRFGWTTIGKEHIPFIFRSNELYCAVHMVEMKVLNKLLRLLHEDLFTCVNIRSYHITEAEARLLNEINFKHSNCQFGMKQFQSADLIVRTEDAINFVKFLIYCYNKLMNFSNGSLLNMCGFIIINREFMVPYTMHNGQKFVPLFYFEGNINEHLRNRIYELDGWNLSYLKFCCKLQGVRVYNEYLTRDSCSVINLTDIKRDFPPSTTFEEYWPMHLNSQLLIMDKRKIKRPTVSWTRQPITSVTQTHPPPTNSAAKPPCSEFEHSSSYCKINLDYGMAKEPPKCQTTQLMSTSSTEEQTVSVNRPSAPHMPFPPPPLIPISRVPAPFPSSSRWNPMYSRPGPYFVPQTFQMTLLRNEQTQIQCRSNNFDGNMQNRDLLTVHQRSTITSDGGPMIENGGVSSVDNSDVISVPTTANRSPYMILDAMVDGKLLPSINMKRFIYTDLLVTLSDIVFRFFPNVSLQSCAQVMEVLGIDLYQANYLQMKTLLENGKCENTNDTVWLVQVHNVNAYMPQLKYMLNRDFDKSSKKRQ